MGSQSTLPPVKSDELVRAIRRLGIPCYLGGMSRGLLGPDSPLQVKATCLNLFKSKNLNFRSLGSTTSPWSASRCGFNYFGRVSVRFPSILWTCIASQSAHHCHKPKQGSTLQSI